MLSWMLIPRENGHLSKCRGPLNEAGLEWDLIKSEFSGTWSQSHPPQKAKLKKKVLFVYRGNQKSCPQRWAPSVDGV